MKGIIYQYDNEWLIDVMGHYIPIHPDYINTILSNGSLKPEYQGEVEYEAKRYNAKMEEVPATGGIVFKSYAIPKPVESKGDVWEEAWKEYRNSGGGLNDHLFLNYLKQHYQLTQKQ